ncbi:MAG: type III pantothenate kinase [Clostridiales Family XIII bacterium]|jgi:type III pantothenate kinase|nr:type III pantothenate kinase [Clostridiales Family XIII bacterium]
MLLAIDIGNTNIVLGVFQDGKLTHNWRMETIGYRSADEYGMVINQLFEYEGIRMTDVKDMIISTVVPSVLYTLQHMAQKYFGHRALVIGPGIKTGLKIIYDDPTQVGADRIVNAVAALQKYGGPLIIIDLGTATTFCCVTADWRYVGGAIAPGLKISSDALFEKTAKLPRIELDEPRAVICKNTIESMQSGLIFGHRGMVEYLTARMKKELEKIDGSGKPIRVVATGGVATLMAEGIPDIDIIDKMLTLEGLYFIYEKNRRNHDGRGRDLEQEWPSAIEN